MRRIALAALLAVLSSGAHATPLPPAEQAALQSSMFQFIDRQLVGERFLDLDLASGVTRALYPAKAHPMILRMGDGFVLCTDFRDEDGKAVNVDFYVAPSREGYVVYHSEIDNRGSLKALMAAGKVTSAD